MFVMGLVDKLVRTEIAVQSRGGCFDLRSHFLVRVARCIQKRKILCPRAIEQGDSAHTPTSIVAYNSFLTVSGMFESG